MPLAYKEITRSSINAILLECLGTILGSNSESLSLGMFKSIVPEV